jgi:hypothetical protein
VDSALALIVLLVLVDVGADVVVANLVRQRQRIIVDLPAHRPAAPPRSVRSLLFWYPAGVLIQTGSIVAVVYACLVNLSAFGAAEPLPAGRPMLITAIVAAVLLLITVPGLVLIVRGLRHGKPAEWRYLVSMGRFAPVVSAIIAGFVVGACLVLTVPEPVQLAVVGLYLVNFMWSVPCQRAFLHLDTWLWFGWTTRLASANIDQVNDD